MQNGQPAYCKQIFWNSSDEGTANPAKQQLLWLAEHVILLLHISWLIVDSFNDVDCIILWIF